MHRPFLTGCMCLQTCAAKVPVRAMTDVYENRAAEIWKHHTGSLMASVGLSGVVGEKYDPSGLEAILKEKSAVGPAFNGRRALTASGREDEDADGQEEEGQRPLLNPDPESSPKVCVVVSEETGRQPPYQKLLFRTYRTEVVRARAVSECALWEAGRATSAAPSYFPPVSTLSVHAISRSL